MEIIISFILLMAFIAIVSLIDGMNTNINRKRIIELERKTKVLWQACEGLLPEKEKL